MKDAVKWFAGLGVLPRALFLWPLLAIVFGVPTALVPFPLIHYKRMIPATAVDYLLLAAISGLVGLYASYRLQKNAPEKGHDLKAFGATVVGLFSFACPICSVLLVSLLGSAFVMAYFEPVRHPLGAVAVIVLTYLIWLERKKCSACREGD